MNDDDDQPINYRFVHEQWLMQQNTETFKFCLPGKNKGDDYEVEIKRFFKQEPCLYSTRVYCLSSFVYGCLKKESTIKAMKKLRMKSSISQRLKGLINNKQSITEPQSYLKDSSLWRKIEISNVIKMSQEMEGEGIVGDDDAVNEMIKNRDVRSIDEESIEIVIIIVSDILEETFDIISKENNDGEKLTCSDDDDDDDDGDDEEEEDDNNDDNSAGDHKTFNSTDFIIPDFDTELEKRLTYKLAYETLKYQDYIQEILDKSKFFYKFFELIDDIDLVMVILCDYKLRKFQRRTSRSTTNDYKLSANNYNDDQINKTQSIDPSDVINKLNRQESSSPLRVRQSKSRQNIRSEFSDRLEKFELVDEAVYSYRFKLNASLARCLIKLSVPSLISLLPQNVRRADSIAPEMFVCCWINQLKISIGDMISKLMENGFVMVSDVIDMIGDRFMFDLHCYDVIYFPADRLECLQKSVWRKEGFLVIQDKSSSLAAHSIYNLGSQGMSDIVHINPGCGLSTCHVASLFHCLESKIFVVGVGDFNQKAEFEKNIKKFGLTDKVQVIDDLSDIRLADVRLALVTSCCSKSGLVNPVHFLLDEGEDLTLLKDLAEGYTNVNKINKLSIIQASIMKKVIMLPSIQGIVYYTRSFMECENERVVISGLEHFSREKPAKPPFRTIPSVLSFSEDDLTTVDIHFNGQFVAFQPTKFNNGCFLATITKEADDPREKMIEIIARAEARGIIKSDATDIQQTIDVIQTLPSIQSIEDGRPPSSNHPQTSSSSSPPSANHLKPASPSRPPIIPPRGKHSIAASKKKTKKERSSGAGSSLKSGLRSAITKDLKSREMKGPKNENVE